MNKTIKSIVLVLVFILCLAIGYTVGHADTTVPLIEVPASVGTYTTVQILQYVSTQMTTAGVQATPTQSIATATQPLGGSTVSCAAGLSRYTGDASRTACILAYFKNNPFPKCNSDASPSGQQCKASVTAYTQAEDAWVSQQLIAAGK